MRIRVKICGVRTVEAIEAAVAAGADAIGFVLTPSPRRLDIETARNLACHVPTFVSRVAVLHQPSTRLLNAVCSELAPDVIQCEPSAAIADIDRPFLPVFHDHPRLVSEVARYREQHAGPVHVEAPGRGGQGRRADLDRASEVAALGRTVLAGGLDPSNVVQAIETVRPWAVDVSSGCESTRGVKDPERIEAFLAAVHGCTAKGPVETTAKATVEHNETLQEVS